MRIGRVILCLTLSVSVAYCVCPTPNLPAGQSPAWQKAATVVVSLDLPSPYDPALFNGPILGAFTDWSNANSSNQSYVWFNANQSFPSTYVHTVTASSGIYYDSTGAAHPEAYAQTSWSNRTATTTLYLGSAFWNSADRSGFQTFLQKAMRHEIGHTMGLWDEPSGPQTPQESVMNAAVNPNDSGGNLPSSITNCDNQQVHNVYQGATGGSGGGQSNGYMTETSQYTVEDDSEGGCACWTTYEVTDYYYNGVWQYSTQRVVNYWCSC